MINTLAPVSSVNCKAESADEIGVVSSVNSISELVAGFCASSFNQFCIDRQSL